MLCSGCSTVNNVQKMLCSGCSTVNSVQKTLWSGCYTAYVVQQMIYSRYCAVLDVLTWITILVYYYVLMEMDDLTVNTLQLWPRKARNIIRDKELSVRVLRKKFKGNIVFPWDDNYDQQRMLFSSQIQERPLFIIRPESEDEIIQALDILKIYNMTIRIVGGRHSTALQNPDIFLDMSYFNEIRLGKYLHVGAGATQGQVNAYLFENHPDCYFPGTKPNHPNSLAFPGGTAATVGVAGISTAGGIGTLRRTLGLTVDAIKAFKIVLPPTKKEDGRVVIASKSKNSRLFWALLGGGAANFGIVTEIYYHVMKVDRVVMYQIEWDFSEARRVLTQWQKTAPERPNNFTEDLAIFNAVDDKLGIELTGVYVVPDGQTINNAKRLIHKELKLLGGDLTFVGDDYNTIYKRFVDERVYHSFSVGKTFLTNNEIPVDLLLERLEQASHNNGLTYIGLQLMGGKISDKSSSETAFFPRSAKFFVDIFNFWDSPVDQEQNMKWNGKTFNELYPIIGPYSYLGFPVPSLVNNLRAYYGDNLERLQKIKKRIDPLGLLKFPGSL